MYKIIKKTCVIIVSIVALLLFIPIIAMQFTDEVKFALVGFLVATVLLLGTGLIIGYIIRKVKRTSYRVVLPAVLLITLFLIWVQLAVGIFGSPLKGI